MKTVLVECKADVEICVQNEGKGPECLYISPLLKPAYLKIIV